jgi:hypothetical protein
MLKREKTNRNSCTTLLTAVEFDGVDDLSGADVNLDGVVNFNQGIRVADGPTVVRHKIWNSLWSHTNSLNLAQLVLQ